MGAWGADTFDNDAAGDWSYGLEGADGLTHVRTTLDAVIAVGDGYLDVDAACEGLAACEVVARLKGNWGARNAYSESVDRWVEGYGAPPPAGLTEMALAVIERVLTTPSELLELWEEDDPTEWHSSVENLRSRVET